MYLVGFASSHAATKTCHRTWQFQSLFNSANSNSVILRMLLGMQQAVRIIPLRAKRSRAISNQLCLKLGVFIAVHAGVFSQSLGPKSALDTNIVLRLNAHFADVFRIFCVLCNTTKTRCHSGDFCAVVV